MWNLLNIVNKTLVESIPIWKYGIKLIIALIFLCVIAIIYFWLKKRNECICIQCGKVVKKTDHFCAKCGTELHNQSNVILASSKYNKVFWVLFISILILLTIGTIIIGNEFNKGTFSNYSTGMYSGEVFQLYEQSDDTWGIQCDKALSSGTFNHMISVDDFLPKRLIIESSSSGGTLILNVIQNDKVVNSFDISNTDGEKEYELVQLENEKIKLSVEHTKISNTRFKIRWE